MRVARWALAGPEPFLSAGLWRCWQRMGAPLLFSAPGWVGPATFAESARRGLLSHSGTDVFALL